MNGILHSTKQFTTNPTLGFVSQWTPVKCSEGYDIYDSHFVAALVFFIATVERTVNTTYSLSQSNPVTASNSFQFDRIITMDAFYKQVYDNTLGVNPYDPTTVAFFTKNHFQYTQSGLSKAVFDNEETGLS